MENVENKKIIFSGVQPSGNLTLGNYLTICRLKNAIKFLSDNDTVECVAEKCGFSDGSGLIRAFKKHFNTTPYQYIKTKRTN